MQFLVLILSLIALSIVSFSQPKKSNREMIIGSWMNYWDLPRPESGKLYSSEKRARKMGQNLIFKADGAFEDTYYAPCGNDGDIHKYVGKWKLTQKGVIKIFDLEEKFSVSISSTNHTFLFRIKLRHHAPEYPSAVFPQQINLFFPK